MKTFIKYWCWLMVMVWLSTVAFNSVFEIYTAGGLWRLAAWFMVFGGGCLWVYGLWGALKISKGKGVEDGNSRRD